MKTAILNYLLVYENKPSSEFYEHPRTSPIGYGIQELYTNKKGDLKQRITIVDNKGNILSNNQWYSIKVVSSDFLIVMSDRSDH